MKGEAHDRLLDRAVFAWYLMLASLWSSAAWWLGGWRWGAALCGGYVLAFVVRFVRYWRAES